MPKIFSVATRSFSSAFAPKATAIVVRHLRSGFCRTTKQMVMTPFLWTSPPNTRWDHMEMQASIQALGSSAWIATSMAQETFTSYFAPQIIILSMKHGRGAT